MVHNKSTKNALRTTSVYPAKSKILRGNPKTIFGTTTEYAGSSGKSGVRPDVMAILPPKADYYQGVVGNVGFINLVSGTSMKDKTIDVVMTDKKTGEIQTFSKVEDKFLVPGAGSEFSSYLKKK